MGKQGSGRGNGTDAKAQANGSSNVFELFPQGRRRRKAKRSAYPTEEELTEYRAMLAALRQIVREFPEIKRRVEANTLVTSHCVLAQSILKGDTL